MKIAVLVGHVGAGKSYLANAYINLHHSTRHVDVVTFIQKYKTATGFKSAEDTLKAYDEMYSELKEQTTDCIVELGTSNPAYNIDKLTGLGKAPSEMRIFFCVLDPTICMQRLVERGKQEPKRIIDPKNLEEKFKRLFPDEHERLASSAGLAAERLDMLAPFEQLVNALETFFTA